MRSVTDAEQSLHRLGTPSRSHIASGMEGHVFDVGNGQVAKVWHAKGHEEITRLQVFYDVLADLGLPFDTPLIVEVHSAAESVVSIERALHGRPMSDLVTGENPLPPRFMMDAVGFVLDGLRNRPVRNARSSLPILGMAPRAGHDRPIVHLLDVARRNVERYGDQLRRSVQDFDQLYERTVRQVIAFPDTGPHVVHGDLVPPNILLDADLNVSAVIDWGFLSHFGESSFDVSIACGIFNMYGTYHRENDDYLMSKFAEHHGYDRRRLLVYRALYAILTSNVYSEEGTDGHYGWCVNALNRDDVREALG